MKHLHPTAALTGALLLLLATVGLPAQTTPAPVAPAAPAATATAPTTTTAPVANVDRYPNIDSILPVPGTAPWWVQRHAELVARIKQGNVNLLFVGDSITHQWEYSFPTEPEHNYLPIWQEFYGDRNAVNLGMKGDETQAVLWRLSNGELEGISPKAAVVMIGTNNTSRHKDWTPVRTLNGILADVEYMHRRLPNTKILLLGIFPSTISPLKSATDETINGLLRSVYSGSSYVTFMDIGNVFRKDGAVDGSLFYEKNGKYQHPNAAGQRKWAEAIEPTLSQMLGDKNKLQK
jgi:lysophospholipase L1-like esterase